MSLTITDVVIEATRKCNMRCEHCLRGAAQRKSISDNHVYKFLNLIDNIGTLTISGGEPTLAMPSLKQIENCIRYGSVDVGNFYMVTNGKSICVDDLADWIYNMYEVCSDNEISMLGFSFDTFHTQMFNWKQLEKHQRNFDRLQEVMECSYGITGNGCGASIVGKHSDKTWGYHSLITEGRGEEIGTREINPLLFETWENDNDIQISETTLYLSSNGYIVSGCDWSYHSIDTRKDIRIAHIDDINCSDDLIEAIKKYNAKLEKTLQSESVVV